MLKLLYIRILIYPVELRISDLLSRMTLEEKVGQMNIPTCYSDRSGMGTSQ